MVGHDFSVVLGRDYGGTVEAVGANVEGYAVGDEVFGFLLHANPAVHEGSWAELIAVTPGMQVAPKPASLDIAAAGAAPLAGIAALAAVAALALSEGETVLIVGATGGVGSFAVQSAARAGATIIAPGAPGGRRLPPGARRHWFALQTGGGSGNEPAAVARGRGLVGLGNGLILGYMMHRILAPSPGGPPGSDSSAGR